MNKQDVKNLVDGMPDGMDVDDYLVELVNRALFVEREACAKVCDYMVDAEYATGKVDHNEMGWTQACATAIRARREI